MEILKPFIILMLSVLILLGCGQQTLKDEDLETKEISDAATTTSSTQTYAHTCAPYHPSLSLSLSLSLAPRSAI